MDKIEKNLDTKGEFLAYIQALEDLKQSFVSKINADINCFRDAMRFVDFDKKGKRLK